MLLQMLLFSPSSKAPFYLYHHFISPHQSVSVWSHQPSASASSSAALPTAANWGQCRYLISFKTCFSLVRVFLYIMQLELTLVFATEVPSVLIPGWFSCIKIITLKKMNEFAWMILCFKAMDKCAAHMESKAHYAPRWWGLVQGGCKTSSIKMAPQPSNILDCLMEIGVGDMKEQWAYVECHSLQRGVLT